VRLADVEMLARLNAEAVEHGPLSWTDKGVEALDPAYANPGVVFESADDWLSITWLVMHRDGSNGAMYMSCRPAAFNELPPAEDDTISDEVRVKLIELGRRYVAGLPTAVPSLLYHYTGPTASHLGSILAEGRIRTTRSNISPERERSRPDVVWLTDSADPKAQTWILNPQVNAGAALVVELPVERVHHWPAWSREQGLDEAAASAGGSGGPNSWWVTTKPVERWQIKRLVIAPLIDRDGKRQEMREFTGDDLSRLFRSAGARNALNLPETSVGTSQARLWVPPGT
jgi:hypothetical protein